MTDIFTPHELGRRDFENGAPRWPDRAGGWDAAYRDSLEKATGGLRRIHAGRYESEDGYWSIVATGARRWSLMQGYGPGFRSQTEIGVFPKFAEAMGCLRAERGDPA
jgi:hypothetical protein